uniref:Large ribosomal subunit protein bL32c n=1 Tax=Cuscuta nitida TaxID=192831 RepID=A0A7H0DGJ7_9ASTE|nr:ribosomal protein L32 [Cuscuta nitida]QNP08457.1 ribosomal protein L32 [Cuscuta nitida]
MAVPKKRISKSKKRIRKNTWKRKSIGSRLKAISLGKSLLNGSFTSFFYKNKEQ